MKIGGPIEEMRAWNACVHRSSAFPPMKIGGPIEEIAAHHVVMRVSNFPPMKIGGPIEASHHAVNVASSPPYFPPMKIGGPIEASSTRPGLRAIQAFHR